MSAVEKAEVLVKVTSSSMPKRKVLRELGVPRSTYYRWLRRPSGCASGVGWYEHCLDELVQPV